MLTDKELLERFKAGDAGAFEALVERYKREVYGLAYRYTGTHADAHDLSQEAFLRLYRGALRFRGESSFRTWLYRIVMNLGLNHVERQGRRRKRQVALEDAAPLSTLSHADERVDQQRQREQLGGAIKRLPPRQRQTLILKVYKELRFKDIAELMRCSVGTAKANYFHAVARLRRELAGQGESHG
jgi:RNA polymerase sigma-70 factor (ECF subfamily)